MTTKIQHFDQKSICCHDTTLNRFNSALTNLNNNKPKTGLTGFILYNMQSKYIKFSGFLVYIIFLVHDLHVNPVNPV